MKSNTIALTRPENTTSAYRWIDQFAKKIFMSKFSEIRHGRITLREGHTEHNFGKDDPDYPLHVTISVHDPSF